MNTGPLVSIILPSYNYAQFLPEAIESVINQTYHNWELIILDDASTDESSRIAEDYEARHPEKIRLISLSLNQGLKFVIHKGISEAKGEFVAFLEADDYWRQDSLEKKLKHILSTNASLVYSNIETIGLESFWKQEVDKSLQSKILFSSQTQTVFANSSIFFMNYIPTFSCVLANKKKLEQLDFTTPLDYRLDHWLWTQLSLKGTFSYLNEKLTYWRIHEGSYSSSHQRKEFDKNQIEYSNMLLRILANGSKSKEREIEYWLKDYISGKNLIQKTLIFLESKRVNRHHFWKFIIKVKDLTWLLSVRLKRSISSIKNKSLAKIA